MSADFFQEERDEEKIFVKEQWKAWDELIEAEGNIIDEQRLSPFGKYWEIGIDRSLEDDSLVTSEEISLYKPGIPLEEWVDIEDQIGQTLEGEEWITIIINPQDPYRLRLASTRRPGEYTVDSLELCLSNKGRFFQRIGHNNTLILENSLELKIPNKSYLKRLPAKETLLEDNYGRIEPWESLQNTTIERLEHILRVVQKGEFIDLTNY